MGTNKATEKPLPSKPFESMGGEAIDDYNHSRFQCCVCLDLLYKPIILACGHISCFWCMHNAMDGLGTSHCAMCREPYVHFPSICQLVHHLLLKLEPAAYKRRETEVLEEEKRRAIFSPQFGETPISDNSGTPEEIEGSSDLKANLSTANQICVDDVSCESCKELLFHPAALNCGHVFCNSCLIKFEEAKEPLKCPVCQSLHPGGLPNVCLDLDHFLEEQFPKEYERMQLEVGQPERVQLKRAECQNGESSSGTPKGKNKTKARFHNDYFTDEELRNLHVGVGCDSCGIYPIIGKRYKCEDCKEVIGFDLCEACYNSSSKLPGRFNQHHTPEHKFTLDVSSLLPNVWQRFMHPHFPDEEINRALYITQLLQEDHDDSRGEDHDDFEGEDGDNLGNNDGSNVTE